ncbi:MAG TPA: ABC transporter ATP-binding protein [Actinomycetes bacterium]|nr:ABC transporter ATP-binding protein [Actinomycetes bacterium]
MSAQGLGQWRGVAAEQADEVPSGVSALLRSRSRRLLGSLLRPHRRRLGLLLAVVLVENAAAMAGPYLVKLGIDRGIPPVTRGGGAGPLAAIVALLVLAAVVQAVTLRVFLVQAGRLGQQLLYDLRTRVFDHFQRLSLSFHERYTSGRVISRLTSDMDAIAEVLDGGLEEVVTAVLSVASIGVIILLLDWPLGLVTLCVFPLLLLLTRWFRRRSAAAYRRTREAVALVIVWFTESLGGIRAVQAFRREPRNQEIFDGLNRDYQAATMRSFRLLAVYGPTIKLLGNTTVAVVLLYGGVRALDQQMTVGVLAAFLLYLRRFFEPMQELSQFYNSLQSGAAALEKLAGVLDEPPSVPEPPQPVSRSRAARGAVRFEGVRFGYRDRPVLPHLDLDIPAGQTVALVGETGAGKTTVARLLARFYDPQAGRVTLDGVDLRDLAEEELRRAVVIVTQESFLFSGTVADNVSFGRPGASRAEVERAARAIGAHGFIAALPDGYDTDVRKRGGRLSAGQRQLVAFARAFLADPAVLVLDEATSSLDVPSERLVQRALRTILADRTAVIIAHRLSTVEIADRVLVVHGGRVVEDGTPAGLLAGPGRYADLRRAWLDSLA